MKSNFLLALMLSSFIACDSMPVNIQENNHSYILGQNLGMSIILGNDLSSNSNQRGDLFSAVLKTPILYHQKTIVPVNTHINGIVKNVVKYKKFGDQAALLLIFDQLNLPDGKLVPILASLDTAQGKQSIKIKGKELRASKIVGESTVLGGLAGDRLYDTRGTEKGTMIGSAIGMGLVIYSNQKEINLPKGTELMIKLDQTVIIPK